MGHVDGDGVGGSDAHRNIGGRSDTCRVGGRAQCPLSEGNRSIVCFEGRDAHTDGSSRSDLQGGERTDVGKSRGRAGGGGGGDVVGGSDAHQVSHGRADTCRVGAKGV